VTRSVILSEALSMLTVSLSNLSKGEVNNLDYFMRSFPEHIIARDYVLGQDDSKAVNFALLFPDACGRGSDPGGRRD
jgi:hypothetical protein